MSYRRGVLKRSLIAVRNAVMRLVFRLKSGHEQTFR